MSDTLVDQEHAMTAAFIEHRPKSSDKNGATTHHVIVVDGEEVGTY